MLVSQIEFDEYFGKMLIGKIHSGSLKLKDIVQAVDL
jgi:predicted membrane GTPase involved in stress response